MGWSWERRQQGAWKFGFGIFSGPLDIHLILPLIVGLGHSLRGTHRMEGWCWKCVSVLFISQEAAERRGCLLPLPKCGSLFLFFFFPKIKFAIQSDWQLSWWKRTDLSHSPELWTLQHLYNWENCPLSEVLSPKTEVVIRRSLASKMADCYLCIIIDFSEFFWGCSPKEGELL